MKATNNSAKQRHTLFIDPAMQKRLILYALGPLLFLIAGFLGVILWLFHSLRTQLKFEDTNSLVMYIMETFGPDFSSDAMFRSLELYTVIGVVIISIIFIAYIIYVFTLFSNRIAGPMYRIDQTLSALSEGDLSVQIHLRDKDEFQYAADTFNSMISNLRERIHTIGQMNRYFTETMQKIDGKILAENREVCERMRELNENINKALDEFKT